VNVASGRPNINLGSCHLDMTLLPTGTAKIWRIYILNVLPQPPELYAMVPLVISGTDSGGSKCIYVSTSRWIKCSF
jgi:hypothetical protein